MAYCIGSMRWAAEVLKVVTVEVPIVAAAKSRENRALKIVDLNILK